MDNDFSLDATRAEQAERIRLKKEYEEAKIRLLDDFLANNSPETIEKELGRYIIGQPSLVKQVSDFIYYQAMRHKHHELPSRPIMICGPSGSGKTEIWRVAQKLYGHIFKIAIADGTKFSSEGWSGSYKLSSFLRKDMDNGILVIDEFDKLAKPRYASGGSNVGADLQMEFLKILEDNYVIKDNKHPDDEITVERIGVVFVGAFEPIRERKCKSKNKPIGFGTQEIEQKDNEITEYDLFEYGIVNELVGRICGICNTNPLTEQQCLQIIKGKNSRTGIITRVLSEYGINPWVDFSDSDIMQLIRESETNKMGIRAVMTKVESALLNSIRGRGLEKARDIDIQSCFER